MARWITVKEGAVPFDYKWPTVNAITAFTAAGEHFVKDQVADYAVGRGLADEGKAVGSNARKQTLKPRKRAKPATASAKAAIVPSDVAASHLRTDDGMDEPRLASDDRADVRSAVGQASEQ